MPEHDASYKLLFSHREMVADLIGGFVDGDWTQALDFETLERVREIGVSHDLRERDDDILWRVRLTLDGQRRWLYVYPVLEFQSTVDQHMAVRLMTYVGLLFDDLRKAGCRARSRRDWPGRARRSSIAGPIAYSTHPSLNTSSTTRCSGRWRRRCPWSSSPSTPSFPMPTNWAGS